jgi:ferrous iron transport protein B
MNVLLIGKPNCGKSLLFQKLTGFYQKVANFPGVTVEVKKAKKDDLTFIDFPGAYSLNAITEDEKVAIEQLNIELNKNDQKVILCVLDALQLERSLIIALQTKQIAAKANCPVIFTVNMMDEVTSMGKEIDLKGLQNKINVPIVGISAKQDQGIKELQTLIKNSGNHQVPEQQNVDPVTEAIELNKEFGIDREILIKTHGKLDKIFLSSSFGGITFLAIMIFLFQAIFTWAGPLMDGTEAIVLGLGNFVSGFLPDGIFKDFINDAIFGGLGSFVVFAPQIAVLTFIIGLLEDSGYLARATVIGHLPLKLFGLSGKSFVPYLSGHACAIPAIMAARTIESPRKRLLTILTIPFTSCSARLPVYALLITAFIPATNIAGGIITYQGLAFFGLYFLGIFCALIVSAILNKTIDKNVEDAPFILELPRFRMPAFQSLFRRSLQSAWTFIVKAGPIIFVVNLVIWALGYFPQSESGLAGSYLASIGKLIDPLFSPIGVDWRYGVAILVSFLAREVFVGTLGTLFGIEGADENIGSLSEQIQADGLSFASGVALLVFYALALQCVSTLAVIKQETGSRKMPIVAFIGYTLFAYIAAILTYQMLI